MTESALPLNRKAIILLFLANAISGIAQGISMIAIPWYFAQKDMLGFFGIVYLITNIIAMFWVPWSGTLVDKYDRKKLFLFITATGASFLALISGYGHIATELPIAVVASVFVFTFLHYNIHYPNLYAFVQEITPKEKYSKMTSLLEIIGQCTTVSAGAVSTLLLEGTEGGLLKIFGTSIDIGMDITPWSIEKIFLLDMSTYFVAFGIISLIQYTPLAKRSEEVGSLVERLKTGWRYLTSHKNVFWFGVLSYMVFLAMLLEAFYLGVSYVDNHLQGSGDVYANSKMTYALGAICTGLTLKYLFTRVSLPLITVILTFVTGMIFYVQYSSNSISTYLIMLFVLGITNSGTRISRITYLFRNVPNQYFGRSGSIFFLSNIFFRVVLLAIFTQPFYQTANNIIYAYLITSVVLFAAVILLIYHYKSFDLSHTA